MLMVKTATNPGGLPKEVFDGFQAQLAANRAQFYYDVPAGPFYGYNRPGAKPSQGVIWNWWRQGMMGGAKAHYDGIVAFSRLKTYQGFPHGMPTTEADTINADLLTFLESITPRGESKWRTCSAPTPPPC